MARKYGQEKKEITFLNIKEENEGKQFLAPLPMLKRPCPHHDRELRQVCVIPQQRKSWKGLSHDVLASLANAERGQGGPVLLDEADYGVGLEASVLSASRQAHARKHARNVVNECVLTR
jgi:hypothetical protein